MSALSLRRPAAPLLFAGLVLAAFLLYAQRGREAAARGDRVLSSLDPAAGWVQAKGRLLVEGLWRNAETVVRVVAGFSLALGIGAFAVKRRRALPVLPLLAGASLATWGQVLLWRGRLEAGAWLYVGGMACAAVVGVLRPLRRLPGVPALPPPAASAPSATPGRDEPPPMAAAEWGALGSLTLLGLLMRGYALTELPNFWDDETVGALSGSYTAYGIGDYMRTELLGTGNGVFHVATHFVLHHLFGPSVFSIRLAALLWSVAAIPLLFWLVRRIAGPFAALAATVLFVAAPEQLYWGRSENTFFAPVMAVAIVTAHLGLSMVRRFSPRAVLAAALGMPVSRFAYTPSFVLFTFPFLLTGHAVVFVEGMWRKLRYVVPILALGLLLWIFGLSILEFALAPKSGWRFIDPARVRGVAAWRSGIPADAGLFEVARLQAARISENVGHVLAGMTYHAKYTSHWYIRSHVADPDHNPTISAGLAVLCALGVGYLLGQIQDRRAALLLGWVAIGLLPGCMSDEPEARRISLIFPALPAIAGVFAAAAVQVFRDGGGRWAARAAGAALAVAVALTAFTSLASHLLIPFKPVRADADIRFSRPLYEHCDVVLHNLWFRAGRTVELGNLDILLRPGPPRCSQLLEEKDWPGAALDPRCDFNDGVFSYVLSERDRLARAQALRVTRVGYVLRETPEARPHMDLLTRLYPSARRRELPTANPEDRLIAIEVARAEIDRLRQRQIAGATVRGSLLLPEDGWYRFRLEPPCEGAKLFVGRPPETAGAVQPLLAGLHPFEATLPRSGGCEPAFRIRAEDLGAAGRTAAPLVLGPRAAEAAPTPRPLAVTGWGAATLFAKLPAAPADIGVDGRGSVSVLLKAGAAWEVRRFGRDGTLETAYATELPPVADAFLAVDSEGTCVASGGFDVEVHDRSGRLRAKWKVPYDQPPSDIAIWRDGRILLCFPRHEIVQLFSTAGRAGETLELRAVENPMAAPSGVAVSPDGMLLIVDEKSRAHLFRTPADRFRPERVATFPVSYPDAPFPPDLAGCAFDGPTRLLFPHRSRSAPLVYNLAGQRVLAKAPERDLSAKGFQRARGFSSAGDRLYVIDAQAQAVLEVSRP